jgi:hypothetical protein
MKKTGCDRSSVQSAQAFVKPGSQIDKHLKIRLTALWMYAQLEFAFPSQKRECDWLDCEDETRACLRCRTWQRRLEA